MRSPQASCTPNDILEQTWWASMLGSSTPTSLLFLMINGVSPPPELARFTQDRSAVTTLGFHVLLLAGKFSGLVWKHGQQMSTNSALRLSKPSKNTATCVILFVCSCPTESCTTIIKTFIVLLLFLAWERLFFYHIITIYSQRFKHLYL